MARFYYLGPWVLDETTGRGSLFRAPAGTVGLVDLSPRTAPGSAGFFTLAAPMADAKGYVAFGDDKGTRLEELVLDDAARTAWVDALGMREAPTALTLADLLFDTLTIYSDPRGITGPKPIMPTAKGNCDLHLGGHSLVKRVRVPLDATALPHWDKVREVLRDDYRRVESVAKDAPTQKGRELHQRWLGTQQEKYRLSAAQTSALLIPDDMEKIEPKQPETTITESFNKADSSTLGPDLSWTELLGAFTVVSNRCASVDGDFNQRNRARADSDLSSADHYSQAAMYFPAAGTYHGPACRMPSNTDVDFYAVVAGDGTAYLLKMVASSQTNLESGVSITAIDGDVWKIEADGTTISYYVNGVLKGDVTDTSLTTGVRCGLDSYGANVAGIFDAFQAADLGGAAATRGAPFGSRGTAFNGGRTFMGILR